jgi:hypothetical protein
MIQGILSVRPLAGVGAAPGTAPRAAAPGAGVPQSGQNFALGDIAAPHLAQARPPSGAPHSEQNFPPDIAPQEGHF